MKKLRGLLCILLVMTLGLTMSVTVYAKTGLQVSLGKKVGTLKSTNDLRFSQYALIDEKDGKCTVLNHLGENKLNKTFDEVKPLGYNSNYLIATDYSKQPNSLSLVNADGTVCFEDAAIIEMNSKGRYAVVSYATDRVDSAEEGFLFVKESEGIDLRMTPKEGEAIYAGYSLVYDTQKNRFVDNVRSENSAKSFYFVGNNIIVSNRGEGQKLYGSDGNLLKESTHFTYYGNYIVTDTHAIIGEDMKEICELDFSPQGILNDAKVFAKSLDGGGYQLVDSEDKPFSDITFAYVPKEYGNYIYGQDSDNNYAVISSKGKTVLKFSDMVESVISLDYGFLRIEYKNGNKALLYPDGKQYPLKDTIDDKLISNFTDKKAVFLLDKGKYQSMNGFIDSLASMVFKNRDDSNLYRLYSAVDGKELLDKKYKDIKYSNGYIYALRDGEYEIYEVKITAP